MFGFDWLPVARVNSGELWYFCPGELVSPKREYQKLLPRTCASCCSSDELLFWARVHLAQARRSRLSERTRRPLFPLFKFSPRRKELAWARPFSLSENWVRMCSGPVCFSVLGCLPHVWLDYYVKAWNEWFCMYWMVCGMELMRLAWSWHVTWMGWLVINVEMELVCIMTLCWLEKHDVGVVRT